MLFRSFIVLSNFFLSSHSFLLFKKNVIKHKHSMTLFSEDNSKLSKQIQMNDTDSLVPIIKVDSNKILFYGPINRNSCFQLQVCLSEFEKNRHLMDNDILHLHIQSQGGFNSSQIS